MTDRIVLTVPEAARALGASKNTVYELVRTRQIPHVRIGTRIRIPKAALETWLERQAVRSTR